MTPPPLDYVATYNEAKKQYPFRTVLILIKGWWHAFDDDAKRVVRKCDHMLMLTEARVQGHDVLVTYFHRESEPYFFDKLLRARERLILLRPGPPETNLVQVKAIDPRPF